MLMVFLRESMTGQDSMSLVLFLQSSATAIKLSGLGMSIEGIQGVYNAMLSRYAGSHMC